jgi:hypothetical protein
MKDLRTHFTSLVQPYAIAEIALIAALLLKVAVFPEYTISNQDDFDHSFLMKIEDAWHIQNRIQWIPLVPVLRHFQRWLILHQPGYLPILIGMSGPIALYIFIRSRIGRVEAIAAGSVYLALQVSLPGYHIPTGYQAISLFFPVAIVGGWHAAEELIFKGTKPMTNLIPWVACGCLAAAIYEYYALVYLAVFCTAYGIGQRHHVPRRITNTYPSQERLTRSNGDREILAYICGLLPALAILGLKLVGYLLARQIPGFSSYSGVSLSADLSPGFANDSILIGVQWVLGSTVGQHNTSDLPKMSEGYSLQSIMYSLFLVYSFSIAWLIKGKWIPGYTKQSGANAENSRPLLILGTSGSIAILGLYVAQEKAHEVFKWSGVNTGYSQQQGDMSLPFIACILGFTALLLSGHFATKGAITRIVTFGALSVMSLQLMIAAAQGYVHDTHTYKATTRTRTQILALIRSCSDPDAEINNLNRKIRKAEQRGVRPYFSEDPRWPREFCMKMQSSPLRKEVWNQLGLHE